MFAWKGETLEEYWDCTIKALVWPDGRGPTTIVDDGGDATLLLIDGLKYEKQLQKNNLLPDPSTATSHEYKIVLTLIKKLLQ